MKKLLVLVLVILAIILSGCVQEEKQQVKKTVVTDVLGRTVEIPEKVDKIVAIGPGALKGVVYMQAEDMLVGVENKEKKMISALRPHTLVIQDKIVNLPVIAEGGPDDPKVNMEVLMKVKPDVIFASRGVNL